MDISKLETSASPGAQGDSDGKVPDIDGGATCSLHDFVRSSCVVRDITFLNTVWLKRVNLNVSASWPYWSQCFGAIILMTRVNMVDDEEKILAKLAERAKMCTPATQRWLW